MRTIGATTAEANTVSWVCHVEVWLTFGAVGTDPVHHLAASCCYAVRIKTCFPVPLKVKLHHCWVLALCQSWFSVDKLVFA